MQTVIMNDGDGDESRRIICVNVGSIEPYGKKEKQKKKN
jgi:hypothetical protein